MTHALNHADRFFPRDPRTREIAKELHSAVADLPIISPHGHCDPGWFALDRNFADPVTLLVQPDHYVLRMLVSQGVRLQDLGVDSNAGERSESGQRRIWKLFAENYHLFLGTPTRMWMDYGFEHLFGLDEPLSAVNADSYFDRIGDALERPSFRPRALFDRFGVEVLATTEDALDPLADHAAIAASGWPGRVITAYRPDSVIDPDFPDFLGNIDRLSEISGCDIASWEGYLDAHRCRRQAFRAMGAVATDHGVPHPSTEDLPIADCRTLWNRIRSGNAGKGDAAAFRGQMLTEMARMSLDDGMTMQIHAGSRRNYSRAIHDRFGRDIGFDIPQRSDFVGGLHSLLNALGHEPGLRIILFTLDETALGRELAPLAGAYPALLLGPAWWFFDSPDGMRRFRELTTETAGFWNTAGFNDDARSLTSIPARHDMARRVDCAFLAERVADHRLSESDAHSVARALTVEIPKRAYGLE